MSLRAIYGLHEDATDGELVVQISRYVARRLRNDNDIRSVRFVGSFMLPKLNDVCKLELDAARTIIASAYELPSNASDQALISAIQQHRIEPICFLQLTGVAFPEVEFYGSGAERIHQLFLSAQRCARRGRPAITFVDHENLPPRQSREIEVEGELAQAIDQAMESVNSPNSWTCRSLQLPMPYSPPSSPG